MRTPRIHDFDPDAKVPELGSPMDNFPSIQKPKQPSNISTNPLGSERNKPKQLPATPVPPVRVVPLVPLERPVHPIRPVLPVPPVKRIMRQRHPFDIYQDQYESLRDLAAEERKQGGVGSMSAMAREALDNFIKMKKKVGK